MPCSARGVPELLGAINLARKENIYQGPAQPPRLTSHNHTHARAHTDVAMSEEDEWVHQSVVRAEATPLSQALMLSLAAPEGGGLDAICIFAWCNEGDNVPDGIQVPLPAAHAPHASRLTPVTPPL